MRLFLPDSGQCWRGAVARDHKGQVYLSVARKLAPATCAHEAEGKAMLMGLHELAARYNGHVLVETDCKVLADDLKEGAQNRSACYGLIMDIRAALANFASYQVKHTARERNSLHTNLQQKLGEQETSS